MRWSNEEIDYLKENYISRSEVIDNIARKLGRTRESVKRKAQRENIAQQEGLWNEGEESYLIDNYTGENGSVKAIANYLDKSISSVYNKAQSLNLGVNRRKLLDKDIDFIENNYKSKSDRELAELLNVVPKTIRETRRDLGLKTPKKRKKFIPSTDSYRDWDKEEVDFLKSNYQKYSFSVLARKLNRTRKSVESKAHRLNLGKKGFPTSNVSSAEIKCKELLDSLDIEYKREKRIDKYSIDFFLKESEICLEVQGDYWHCNPEVYDEPISDTQIRTIEKDKRKEKFLNKNYQVLYIWEKDLKERPSYCKNKILNVV